MAAKATRESFGETLLDDLVAQLDALVADVDAGPGNELLHLLLALSTEGTLEQISTFPDAGHSRSPLLFSSAFV